jgi:ribosome-associated protein
MQFGVISHRASSRRHPDTRRHPDRGRRLRNRPGPQTARRPVDRRQTATPPQGLPQGQGSAWCGSPGAGGSGTPQGGPRSCHILTRRPDCRSDRALTAPPSPDFTSEQFWPPCWQSVDDDKAEDIVQIDLRGRSDVADYMVICSGRSSRQVAAIAEKLADRLKQAVPHLAKMEGKETGDWVLIDSGDVIVHVFRPEVREFYQLEKMWLPRVRPSRG